MSKSTHGFSTRAIHDGQHPDPLTGAVNVPIYLSSTYAAGRDRQATKAMNTRAFRTRRATRSRRILPRLKAAPARHVFASGMAAIMAMITMFQAATTSSVARTSTAERRASSTRSSRATASSSATSIRRTRRMSAAPSGPDKAGAHRDADESHHDADRHSRRRRCLP